MIAALRGCDLLSMRGALVAHISHRAVGHLGGAGALWGVKRRVHLHSFIDSQSIKTTEWGRRL
jgi:hypothetical protein